MARPQKFRLSPEDVQDPQNARKLAGHVQEIEFFRAEIEKLQAQVAGVYDAADEDGFDKKFIRKVVAKRAKPEHERAAEEYGIDAYERAVEKGFSSRARVAVEKIDAETGEITDTSAALVGTVATAMQTEIGRKALTKALDVMIEREEADEVEPCDCADRAPIGEYYRCPDCDAEWPADEETNPPGTAERGAGPEMDPASDGGAVPPMASSSTPFQSSDLHDGRLQAVPAPALDESRDSAAGVEAPAAPVNPRCLKHQRGEECKFSHKRYSCAGCNQAAELQRAGAA